MSLDRSSHQDSMGSPFTFAHDAPRFLTVRRGHMLEVRGSSFVYVCFVMSCLPLSRCARRSNSGTVGAGRAQSRHY